MRRLRLTTAEQEQVAQAFKRATDRRLRDRGQAVWMASRGRRPQTIAQDLGVHRTTVRRWLEQDEARGLDGLVIHWAPGQPARLPAHLAPTMVGWSKDGPQRCGLARANWTYEDLATHVYRVEGMTIKRTAMQDFCRRQGIRPYRPTYHYLRGNPEAQQAAQADLTAFKKKRKTDAVSC